MAEWKKKPLAFNDTFPSYTSPVHSSYWKVTRALEVHACQCFILQDRLCCNTYWFFCFAQRKWARYAVFYFVNVFSKEEKKRQWVSQYKPAIGNNTVTRITVVIFRSKYKGLSIQNHRFNHVWHRLWNKFLGQLLFDSLVRED